MVPGKFFKQEWYRLEILLLYLNSYFVDIRSLCLEKKRFIAPVIIAPIMYTSCPSRDYRSITPVAYTALAGGARRSALKVGGVCTRKTLLAEASGGRIPPRPVG